MFRSPRPVLALVAGVLVVVVAAIAAYAVLPPRQSRDVAMPARDATPEQVVTAYVDALDAHDCDTAEALMATGSTEFARSWCNDVASMTDLTVRSHSAERPKWSGRAPDERVVHVPVTFDLRWRLFHNDGSMDEGPTIWGYYLVRNSSDVPWRIFNQGVA